MSGETMKRKKVDGTMAEARAERERITRETFTQEGILVAFPLCFPGATSPIAADESRIVGLDNAPNGMVYGITEGRAAHLFSGQIQAASGAVVDHGAIEGGTGWGGICALQNRVLAACNTAEGGRLVWRNPQYVKYDLLQEWSFPIHPLEVTEPVVPGAAILSLVRNGSRTRAIGITAGRLFVVEDEGGAVSTVAEIEGRGKLGALGDSIFGFESETALWRYDAAAGQLKRNAVRLPVRVAAETMCWANDEAGGLLYLATADGVILRIGVGDGTVTEVGRAPLPRVTAMAVTHDARLFGFCGEGIQKQFVYEPAAGAVRDLGAAVSVIERRRYGYEFGAAVTGRDGQVYFGERDDLGHLWVYFPTIQA